MIWVNNAYTDLACHYEYVDVDASTNVVQRTPTNVQPNDGPNQRWDAELAEPLLVIEQCPSYWAFS